MGKNTTRCAGSFVRWTAPYWLVLSGCQQPAVNDNHPALIEKIADQSAAIAALEIKNEAVGKALAAAEQQLQQSIADAAKKEADFDALEKVRNNMQTTIDQMKAEHKTLADQNDALESKLLAANRTLESVQSTLAAIEAAQRDRIQRFNAVGIWYRETVGLPPRPGRPPVRSSITLREDGTGVFQMGSPPEREYGPEKKRTVRVPIPAGTLGNAFADSSPGGPTEEKRETYRETEVLDYRFTYSATNEPGVFVLRGAWKETGTPVSATFRIGSDNKTAVVEGWPPNIDPMTFQRDDSTPTQKQ